MYYLALDDEDVAVLDLISKTASEVGKKHVTGSSEKEPEVQDYPPESKYNFPAVFTEELEIVAIFGPKVLFKIWCLSFLENFIACAKQLITSTTDSNLWSSEVTPRFPI